MTKVKDSISRDIIIHSSLEKVWDALTKEEHLNRWYSKESSIDFRVGGRGYLNHGWGATTEGTYTEIVLHKRFVLQSPDEDFQTITELEEVEDGVKVTITYQASYLAEMDAAARENMLFGTRQFLENLKSVYETNQDMRRTFWRVWLGISHSTNPTIPGTKVLAVKEGTAASESGLNPGDIIIELDDIQVLGYESFEKILNTRDIEQPVTLKILRGDGEILLTCPLEKYPVPY